MSQQPIQPFPADSAAPGAQQPLPPAKPGRNTIGLIALIVAVLGFVFAVMEGAYILGWVLLPIGFILGLVGLFARDKPKLTAIAAVIVAIVGTVAGAIAFTSSMGRIVDEAFQQAGTTTVAPATPGVATTTDAAASTTQPATGKRTIELKVATERGATVTYGTGAGSSNEEIKAAWTKTLQTDKSFEIVSLVVVSSDFTKANNVTCEILVDGQSVAQQSGSGTGAMASCTATVS
ncbi:hypothetical protein G7070_06440 [Propioniciclava coleopterorum]|uniref:MmpS family membrane protein n=1 Tax=Propioniciclava coleopterorum TaxID=2714937 RepID=A0A6G7Y5P8_9ACTN|nr:hypothetical protein [Propioniciclava coleopterorum]QIK71968.1 hypothetical protein G7070_06440 [Propioniciclava coleopterorum]